VQPDHKEARVPVLLEPPVLKVLQAQLALQVPQVLLAQLVLVPQDQLVLEEINILQQRLIH
jgi:hypothetical protein